MFTGTKIKAPFFEIGPKAYLYGSDVVDLALAADAAAQKYNVDVIFTAPYVSIEAVARATSHIHVFAPHMDPIKPGRGVADILPESLLAAGATGVLLNHNEKPLSLADLKHIIARADELGLATLACADSLAEGKAVACLAPNIIAAEPSELIGTGQVSDMAYVLESTRLIKEVDERIMVLQAAGISSGKDVFRVIRAGAEGTGSSSGIALAADRAAMVDEMVGAVRQAWDEYIKNS